MTKKYELTFTGASGSEYFPRFRRNHAALDQAQAEALRVGEILDRQHHGLDGGSAKASHVPQIYSPDGHVSTVKW